MVPLFHFLCVWSASLSLSLPPHVFYLHHGKPTPSFFTSGENPSSRLYYYYYFLSPSLGAVIVVLLRKKKRRAASSRRREGVFQSRNDSSISFYAPSSLDRPTEVSTDMRATMYRKGFDTKKSFAEASDENLLWDTCSTQSGLLKRGQRKKFIGANSFQVRTKSILLLHRSKLSTPSDSPLQWWR